MAKVVNDETNKTITPGPDGHSPNYAKVKRYYDKGFWTLKMTWDAVGRWIRADEYEEITGYVYPDPYNK